MRDGKATAEFLSTHRHARRAGGLPFDQVDRLSRQLIHGAMTRHEYRDDAPANEPRDPIASTKASNFASHVLYLRIDIKSTDRQRPLRLMTEARQTSETRIGFSDCGVRGFIHARFCNELYELVFRQLKEVLRADDSSEEVLRRLNELAARVKNMDPAVAARVRSDETAEGDVVKNDSFDEHDIERTIVEARVLGHQAVALRCPDAAPVLEELGQKSLARALRLADSDRVPQEDK